MIAIDSAAVVLEVKNLFNAKNDYRIGIGHNESIIILRNDKKGIDFSKNYPKKMI